jgi:aminoglycoside 6-adenylyltransferase
MESSHNEKGRNQLQERERIVVERLIRWAEAQDAVRAMLLYSSRANPNAPIDEFSDYDVLLAVWDADAFYKEDQWLSDFGAVLTVFRNPMERRDGFARSLFVTHYEDGVKADFAFVDSGYFSFLSQQSRLPEDLNNGYRVLLDKDHLTDSLPAPTYSAYRLAPPDESAFHALAEEFFNDAAYVAKALRRGDLLPAKLSLDHVMKYECLRRALDWRFGIETQWTQASRDCGKGLRHRISPALLTELENTYVGAGIDENWEALFSTIALFRRVMYEVSEKLGFIYPQDQDHRVMIYLNRVRSGDLP